MTALSLFYIDREMEAVRMQYIGHRVEIPSITAVKKIIKLTIYH